MDSNDLNKPSKTEIQLPDLLTNLNINPYVKDHQKNISEIQPLNISNKPQNIKKFEDRQPPSEESQLATYAREQNANHRRSRKIKKVLGYAGWVLFCPLMILGYLIRDKPDPNDPDEWTDDPCMPWYYDVDFRYPGEIPKVKTGNKAGS